MEYVRLAVLELVKAGVISLDELWVAFFSVGGSAGELELEAYLYGLIPVSNIDMELLSPALEIIEDT
ncbi:hypothetical protein [Arthrobacter sp. ISL-28]|uniref:hypothetical protein n=1 Tax=Arthrobacter sp. ISL-28 TaxID=2819108 RepID=UPI001BE78F6E|nr:hypothetical protein [Arthrobacter sp. ISL-28]MBT2523198.1 hypothetical protein [Arthrobacter sp. ISL-28]